MTADPDHDPSQKWPRGNVIPEGRKSWQHPPTLLQNDEKGIANTDSGIAIVSDRNRVEEMLRQSPRLFSAVFRRNPAATILSSFVDGKCVEANEAYSKLTGYTREELIGRTTVELNIWTSADERQRVTTELAHKGHLENVELTLRMKSGKLINTVAAGEMMNLDGQQYILSFFFEITGRKQAEEALRESERRERERATELATLLDVMPMPVFIAHDVDCLHITGNRAADDLLRNPPGAEASLAAPGDMRPRHFKAFKDGRELSNNELPAQRAACGSLVRDFEFSLVYNDGTTRQVLGYGTPLRNEEGRPRGAVHVLVDITERKRAEEALKKANEELERKIQERTVELSKIVQTLRETEKQLRIVSGQRLEAQETERKRIARELHDSVAGMLSGIKFKIEAAILQSQEGIPSTDVLSPLVALIQAAVKETRRIIADLRPSTLDDLGLLAAISLQCRNFEETYGHIRLEKQIGLSETDVPIGLKLPVYRIIQEALNNIAKHSKAELTNLSLGKTNNRIELNIRDNGQGFDLQDARSRESFGRGLGLGGITERAEWSGGTCLIESSIGKGTVICVSWPLPGIGITA
jgi:PAS domain S-box-containing protein